MAILYRTIVQKYKKKMFKRSYSKTSNLETSQNIPIIKKQYFVCK